MGSVNWLDLFWTSVTTITFNFIDDNCFSLFRNHTWFYFSNDSYQKDINTRSYCKSLSFIYNGVHHYYYNSF